MSSRVQTILEYMLEDALDIVRFVGEIKDQDALSGNSLYRKAVIMSILNIGELAKKLPDEFKASNSQIPWKKISGMRDIAAHGYHVMDDEIIWDVATHSIPELVEFLQNRKNI